MNINYFNWDSLSGMFHSLHRNKCEYIVLRNYEELYDQNFYLSGHADIDFLVADYRSFVEIIHAIPRFEVDDKIHYMINIAGTKVIIDVRSVGDDYYDKFWQKAMLKNRYLYDSRFYVTDEKNYYYSLAYHAILQKKALSSDYLERLNAMANHLGIPAITEEEHLMQLNRFMRANNYHYTYPLDIWVPLRITHIDQNLVRKNAPVYMRDLRIKMLQLGSNIKHKIIGH